MSTILKSIIVIGCVALALFFSNKYFFNKSDTKNMILNTQTNQLNENNMKIVLSNSIDKRVLTSQGMEILLKAIKEGEYADEVVNTNYSMWQSDVDKSISLAVFDTEEGHSYIISGPTPQNPAGMAFKFDSSADPLDVKSKVNKIIFNNFKLEDFLNDDKNAVIRQPISQKVSYALNLIGSEAVFDIFINDVSVKQGTKTEWGALSGEFMRSIPINAYLKKGIENEIRIAPKKTSADSELTVGLSDMNKQGESNIGTLEIDFSKGTVTIPLEVPQDSELVGQESIFN